nr:MAG TPA: hypothetical protein [Caudoviricetes sp.]
MSHFTGVFQTSNPFISYSLSWILSILFSFCSRSVPWKFNILYIYSLLYPTYFGSGPYNLSMPARVTNQIRPAFLASLGLNRGGDFLYPEQACCMVIGALPHFSAASAAVMTSSSGFIKTPPLL